MRVSSSGVHSTAASSTLHDFPKLMLPTPPPICSTTRTCASRIIHTFASRIIHTFRRYASPCGIVKALLAAPPHLLPSAH